MIKITQFFLEESKVNKGCMLLIALAKDGQKWVVGADHYSPTYLKKYEESFDTKPLRGDL